MLSSEHGSEILNAIGIIVGILGGLGVPALILFLVKRMFDKNDTKQNARVEEQKSTAEKHNKERERREESLDKYYKLHIETQHKLIQLGEATALAVSGGKINGEMKAALQGIKKVKDDQAEFLKNEFIDNRIGTLP